MTHLVLLGDSILDNGAYTEGGPDVVTQVRQQSAFARRGSGYAGRIKRRCIASAVRAGPRVRAPAGCLHDLSRNFPEPDYRQRVAVALTVFNDVIIRIAIEKSLAVIDLRLVCPLPEDYANPIEPSAVGGAKIARAIVSAIVEPVPGRGARISV